MNNPPATRFLRYLELFVVLAVLLAAGYLAYTRLQTPLEKARGFIEQGDLKSAVVQLKDIVQHNRNNIEAALLLGKVHLALGDGASAVKELQRARELGAPRSDWVVPLARGLILQGAYQPMLQQITLDPADSAEVRSDLLTLSSQAELSLGHRDVAKQRLEQALAAKSDQVDALLNSAGLALQEQRLAEAAAWLERAVAAAPRNADVWNLKGTLAGQQKQYAEALAAYQQVLEFRPSDQRARLGRVEALIALEKYSHATAELNTLQVDLPRFPHYQYLQALILFQQTDLPGTRQALLQALALDSKHLPSLLLLGKVYLAENNAIQAEGYLSRFVTARPDHAGARVELAAAKLALDKPEEAVALLEPLRRQARRNPEGLIMLGHAYESLAKQAKNDEQRLKIDMLLAENHLQRGDFASARPLLSRLIQKQPASPDLHILLGMVHLGGKNDEDARREFEQALRLKPDFTPAVLQLARLDLKKGDYPAAEARYLGILKGDGSHLAALLGMAEATRRAGNATKSREWLEKAWQAHPSSLPAGLSMIQLDLQQEETDSALELAQQLKTAYPNDPGILAVLAQVMWVRGDVQGALANYKTAYAMNPGSVLALRLADACWLAGQGAEAPVTLRNWLELQPHDTTVRTQLAIYLEKLGSWEQAIAEYQRVLAVEPENIVALNNLAGVLTTVGDARSVEYAERVARLARQPEVLDTLGWALVNNNQLERGLALLQQAATAAPQVPLIRYHLATAYVQAGKTDAAREELGTLLSGKQDFPEKTKARALLESLP